MQLYWRMKPLGCIDPLTEKIPRTFTGLNWSQHWLQFTYVTSVLSEWRLWENQPSQLPRVTTSGEGLCCEREPKESRLWDTRWDVSANLSQWRPNTIHLFHRYQTPNRRTHLAHCAIIFNPRGNTESILELSLVLQSHCSAYTTNPRLVCSISMWRSSKILLLSWFILWLCFNLLLAHWKRLVLKFKIRIQNLIGNYLLKGFFFIFFCMCAILWFCLFIIVLG